MKILVTGGSGFVGRQLLSVLSDRQVRVVLRKPVAEPLNIAETLIVGDINHQTDWSGAIRDIDCVVHTAARVHVMQPSADDGRLFHEVNVLGTENLALVAAKAGVRRFVFLSSIKVNGDGKSTGEYSATDVPSPMDEYGRSKWLAEQKLFAIGRAFGMEVVAIRPPLVYGPGVRANFLRLLSLAYKQALLPLGSVRNVRSFVSVWNLCDLIRAVIDAESVSSRVLMVSDGTDLSSPEIIKRLAHAMRKSPILLPVPVPVLKLAGALIGRSAEVARLCGSLTVDISDTKSQMNWAPPVSIDDGLARTAQWYLNEVVRKRE